VFLRYLTANKSLLTGYKTKKKTLSAQFTVNGFLLKWNHKTELGRGKRPKSPFFSAIFILTVRYLKRKINAYTGHINALIFYFDVRVIKQKT
jgi:hypothetical protein